jgi:hypothetical protein
MTFVFFILQDFNSHLDTSLQRYHFQTRKRLFEQKRIKQSIVDEISAESGRKTAKFSLIFFRKLAAKDTDFFRTFAALLCKVNNQNK